MISLTCINESYVRLIFAEISNSHVNNKQYFHYALRNTPLKMYMQSITTRIYIDLKPNLTFHLSVITRNLKINILKFIPRRGE